MPSQALMSVTFRVSCILGSCCISQSYLCKLCFLGLFPPFERKRPWTRAGCAPASLALVYIVDQGKQVFGNRASTDFIVFSPKLTFCWSWVAWKSFAAAAHWPLDGLSEGLE